VKSTKLNVAVAECDSESLVPVTARAYVPARFELQETIAVPEPMMLAGVIGWQVRLDDITSVSATMLVNALSPLTVIVEVAGWPALAVVGDVAPIEKSGKLATSNEASTEWMRELLAP